MVSNLHYYFLFYGRLLFFCPIRDTILEESFLWILYIFLSSAPFLNIFLILKATHLHIFHKKLTVRLQLHNNSHNSVFLTTVYQWYTINIFNRRFFSQENWIFLSYKIAKFGLKIALSAKIHKKQVI